jgi:hypothetical protein
MPEANGASTIVRAVALVATGVSCVFLACGGGSTPTAAPTPTPAPPTTLAATRLTDLSATLTSPDADARFNCNSDVRANVTVTNRGATSVLITGIRKTSSVTSGRCTAASDFTYTPAARFAPGNSSTVVFDRALYRGGSGCCFGEGCTGICGFQETLDVVTELGVVPAGSFTYAVTFKNCPTCNSAAATGMPARARLE